MDRIPTWRKSSYCANGTCVEITDDGRSWHVRDGKLNHSPILSFDRSTWAAFLDGVRSGDFDLR